MSDILSKTVLSYLEQSTDEALELLEAICKIPAPSNHEEKRAAFCKNWLEENGAKGVKIDEALNVLYPVCCENKDKIVLFMAHTDTVFPDMTEPMPYFKDDKFIYSPGVGDDTICLVMMLMIIKYIIKNNFKSDWGILFAANSGEEGLGNLKGIKQIMEAYGDKICEVYTFDGRYNEVINKCVGSHRYKISIETTGGHSFTNFGNTNAISVAADIIHNLNKCAVPEEDGCKTTYNVGLIEGGTSVNTIAQNASFMYEYRSDTRAHLDIMKAFFEKEIEAIKASTDAKITVDTIGIRPCSGDVNQSHLEEITQKVASICEKHTGIACTRTSGSTDANIPMSMGIPAVCVGTYAGGGMHTREEYLEISSIPIGLKIVAELILGYFNS